MTSPTLHPVPSPSNADHLARRALGLALNARPGGRGPGHRPLGEPRPDAAEHAMALLRERTQPGPVLDLALELLERSMPSRPDGDPSVSDPDTASQP